MLYFIYIILKINGIAILTNPLLGYKIDVMWVWFLEYYAQTTYKYWSIKNNNKVVHTFQMDVITACFPCTKHHDHEYTIHFSLI